MSQQFEMADVKCDHIDHMGHRIFSLCVRAQCKEKSACCQRCQLMLHRQCLDHIKFFEKVPQLVCQIQSLETVNENLVFNVNQVLKSIKLALDTLFKPIKVYQSCPNLKNLNNLGDLFRLNPTDDLSQFMRKSQKVISDELTNLFNNFELITEKPKNEPTQRQKEEAEKQIQDLRLQMINIKIVDRLIKEDQQKALNCIEKAIQFVPYNEIYWYKQGCCLQKLNKQLEAIESFDRSIKISPKVEAYLKKGIHFNQFEVVSLNVSNQINESINCCKEGLKLFPNSYKLKLLLDTNQSDQILCENE